MNKQFDQVKTFHAACGIEMPDKPTMLGNDNETNIHFNCEIKELSNRMKEYSKHEGGSPTCDRISYFLEEIAEFANAETIEDQVDAIIDLIYFSIGTFTLMGVKPEEIFNIVHSANMSKVGADGKVMRDAQGKIQKPEGWQEQYAPEPRIRAEIERQRMIIETNEGIRKLLPFGD